MLSPLILPLFLAPAAGPPVPVSQETGPILIRAERVVVRAGEELEDASVLVENGRIVAVGKDLAAPEGARTIQGRVVCAGFVDPWATLGIEGQSARDTNTSPSTRTVDSLDPWGAPLGRLQALLGGVTTARVQAGSRAMTGGVGAVVRNHVPDGADPADLVVLGDACMAATIGVTREREADVFERVGEVGRLVGRIEAGKRYRDSWIEYRDELEAWQKAIDEKVAELEKDFKKAKKDREKEMKEAEEKGKEFKEERYKEDKKPRQPKYDADDEALARVANGEIPLVVEVHRAEEIRQLLQKTEDFARLRLILAGGTEALHFADQLAERRIPVVVWPTPAPGGDEYDGADLALAAELAAAGVEVLIGSGGSDELRELRLLAALAVGHGLDPVRALAAITQGPARAFDLGDRVGTVERGKDADLLVLDGDPLDTTARLRFVVSAGQVVVEQ